MKVVLRLFPVIALIAEKYYFDLKVDESGESTQLFVGVF